MKEHYFDDLKAGDRFKSERFEVTEKQLIEFAYKFDPQMFHLDRKSAERTIFKGLIASGWYTAAITMRLFVRTLNFAEGAIGLGVDFQESRVLRLATRSPMVDNHGPRCFARFLGSHIAFNQSQREVDSRCHSR